MLTHAQQFGASLFTFSTYTYRVPNLPVYNGLYVADLYLAYLQRPPDEGRFEYWKELLDAHQISPAMLREAEEEIRAGRARYIDGAVKRIWEKLKTGGLTFSRNSYRVER